ncbi:hypothetical protein EW145_g749 [Phellinidium pouzarii]|uniref:18S rRNA factor 2 n=1 Tax=Phellinidium pouzarii TaxID=167371 RepID=A0A4V3XDV8_9AGAM|nr:hypothetical protein EW145_g749 [Phellinidium pouzarii]
MAKEKNNLNKTTSADSRFSLDERFQGSEAGPSRPRSRSREVSSSDNEGNDESEKDNSEEDSNGDERGEYDDNALDEGMDPEGYAGPTKEGKTVKPLTPEALAAFHAVQERAGVLYISRIPPGMRPTKVRHLMSQYGEIGRVYLQQEDPKRAYLRKKFTATKKAHFTEGWVEFRDKRVARSVASMLNAQPIGGKKGTRWRDDVWTMKYLPKFKWNMLTEQIAHEAAVHTARLRVELEQSRREQKDYLRQVELSRVLDKRAGRKRKAAEERGEKVEEKDILPPLKKIRPPNHNGESENREKAWKKKPREKIQESTAEAETSQLKAVLSSIF